MDGRLLPCGERAVLVEVANLDQVLALHAAVRRRRTDNGLVGVVELVPAARTLLVEVDADHDLGPVRDELREVLATTTVSSRAATRQEPAIVDVCYDGPDLDAVAAFTGLPAEQVVAAHTDRVWTVAFAGFAPGFGYLTGGDPRLEVPRRAEPRTRVPAGAVGLAGRFSGIYPRSSPGGWQLIGRTSAPLWDPDRDPPALLAPGRTVRFRAVDTADDPQPPTRPGWPSVQPALVVEHVAGLSIVVDEGRPGYAGLGLGRSGAADRAAYRLGARLLGDRPGLVAIEVLMGGLSVRAETTCAVVLTGAELPAAVDGRPVGHATPIYLRAGQILRLGMARAGLRSYLSVRHGLIAPGVLGSASTDTLADLGPRPLQTGDRLGLRPADGDDWPGIDAVPTSPQRPLLVLPGPRAGWLAEPSALTETTWRVSDRSDRIGVRLVGEPLRRHPDRLTAELLSEPMVRGSIQVPPDGQPVIMGADHPVTGGYPVVGVLTEESSDRLAQCRPGQPVRLQSAV